MELEILLPFPSAETMTESWAFSEAQIDFRHDPEAGARCTISYAAVELRTHLLQMEPDAQICFVSQRHNGKAAIELHADSLTASGDAYALLPQKDGLLIRGAGRVGVLNAGLAMAGTGYSGRICARAGMRPSLAEERRA